MVCLVQLDLEDLQETLVHREGLDLQDQQDSLVPLADPVAQDQLVQLGLMEGQVQQVLQGPEVVKDAQVMYLYYHQYAGSVFIDQYTGEPL